jgi:hypothetical protein
MGFAGPADVPPACFTKKSPAGAGLSGFGRHRRRTASADAEPAGKIVQLAGQALQAVGGGDRKSVV